MATVATLTLEGGQEQREERNQVIALARGLQVLQCFTTSRKYLGTSEIARLTRVPQPTVWRLCQTLVQAGFLVSAPDTQKLQLGTSALALGLAANATFDILEIVRPRMQELADRYNAAISIAGRENLDMIYLQRCAAEGTVGTNLQRGSRLLLSKSTLGWAYLVALDEHRRARLLDALRAAYPNDWPEIHKLAGPVLAQYGKKGFVLRRGLLHPGIIAIAVPIVPASAQQPLAINCSAHARRDSAGIFEEQVAPVLKDLATSIARSIDSGSASSNALLEHGRPGTRRRNG